MEYRPVVLFRPWVARNNPVIWNKVFEFEGIGRGLLCLESLRARLDIEFESLRPVVEVNALDVVKDSGNRFQDIGLAAAIAAGETVRMKFETAAMVPLSQEIHFEACRQAAKRHIQQIGRAHV